MEAEDYEVSSELYAEHDYVCNRKPTFNENNVVSEFPFKISPDPPKADVDGDMEVQRRSSNPKLIVEIEHSKSTVLNLVGLQVWRGALLLADWLIHNNEILPQKTILELGSGVGLTSVVAALFRPVICTDINAGGILDLIKHNVARNKNLTKQPIQIKELNFLDAVLSQEIQTELPNVEIILAADVIYDDSLTEAFVGTVKKLLQHPPSRSVYIALEKRYVFTIADCDSVAPCYEHFLQHLRKLENVTLQEMQIDFPQYFHYERAKELALWKVSSKF